jgi:hypothetical protein
MRGVRTLQSTVRIPAPTRTASNAVVKFEPAGERREQLDARGIAVTEGKVEQIEADTRGLTGARLAGGRRVALDAGIVAPRMTARAELFAPLGLKPAEVRHGEHMAGTRIEADPTGATAVPGVWVAGNLADIQAQVITSAASGLTAGAAINLDLVLEEARHAADTHRHQRAGSEPSPAPAAHQRPGGNAEPAATPAHVSRHTSQPRPAAALSTARRP